MREVYGSHWVLSQVGSCSLGSFPKIGEQRTVEDLITSCSHKSEVSRGYWPYTHFFGSFTEVEVTPIVCTSEVHSAAALAFALRCVPITTVNCRALSFPQEDTSSLSLWLWLGNHCVFRPHCGFTCRECFFLGCFCMCVSEHSSRIVPHGSCWVPLFMVDVRFCLHSWIVVNNCALNVSVHICMAVYVQGWTESGRLFFKEVIEASISPELSSGLKFSTSLVHSTLVLGFVPAWHSWCEVGSGLHFLPGCCC